MPDALEELALSGVLFEKSGNPLGRPHSPSSRTPSPNTEDELFGSSSSRSTSPPSGPPGVAESIGMGPRRTGVKGVIRDRDEARERQRVLRDERMQELRLQMERSAITALGNREEENNRRRQNDSEEEEHIDASIRSLNGRTVHFLGGTGRGGMQTYGHLREVGARDFVHAVEAVDHTVWVVVHIYHPNVDRCTQLDIELSSLARRHVLTKFIRVRADALGFAKLWAEPVEDDEDLDEERCIVDQDMLPTLLVYRARDLRFNWVRVDLEAGKRGITDFLHSHHIIEDGGLGARTDQDHDLLE